MNNEYSVKPGHTGLKYEPKTEQMLPSSTPEAERSSRIRRCCNDLGKTNAIQEYWSESPNLSHPIRPFLDPSKSEEQQLNSDVKVLLPNLEYRNLREMMRSIPSLITNYRKHVDEICKFVNGRYQPLRGREPNQPLPEAQDDRWALWRTIRQLRQVSLDNADAVYIRKIDDLSKAYFSDKTLVQYSSPGTGQGLTDSNYAYLEGPVLDLDQEEAYKDLIGKKVPSNVLAETRWSSEHEDFRPEELVVVYCRSKGQSEDGRAKGEFVFGRIFHSWQNGTQTWNGKKEVLNYLALKCCAEIQVDIASPIDLYDVSYTRSALIGRIPAKVAMTLLGGLPGTVRMPTRATDCPYVLTIDDISKISKIPSSWVHPHSEKPTVQTASPKANESHSATSSSSSSSKSALEKAEAPLNLSQPEQRVLPVPAIDNIRKGIVKLRADWLDGLQLSKPGKLPAGARLTPFHAPQAGPSRTMPSMGSGPVPGPSQAPISVSPQGAMKAPSPNANRPLPNPPVQPNPARQWSWLMKLALPTIVCAVAFFILSAYATKTNR